MSFARVFVRSGGFRRAVAASWLSALSFFAYAGCDNGEQDPDTNREQSTSGDSASTQGSGGDDGGTGDPVYCADVQDWMENWSYLEREVLELVNEAREQGADCGSEGSFAPAQPLKNDPSLRCAARVHSKDMAVKEYFDHVNLEGESPSQRIKKAGFNWMMSGENIAVGQETAEQVMDGWMKSPGHCRNIMQPDFTHIGVGYVYRGSTQYRHHWTQNFGTPR